MDEVKEHLMAISDLFGQLSEEIKELCDCISDDDEQDIGTAINKEDMT